MNQNTPEMFFDKRMQLEQIHNALEPDFLQVSENDGPGCPNLLGLDKGDRISGIREGKENTWAEPSMWGTELSESVDTDLLSSLDVFELFQEREYFGEL